MWSHTIKSSALKSTNSPAKRPTRVGSDLKEKDGALTTPEEDMTKEFDVDGFSKMSKVHASKKPLTVAKAPSFGRATSRVGQTAISETGSPRKDSQNKNAQPVKPTQTSRIGTPGPPPLTATPTRPSSKASKAGTPIRNRPAVTSPNHTAPGRRLTNTSTSNGVQSPGSENAAPGLDTYKDTHKPDESGEPPANDNSSEDGSFEGAVPKVKELQDHQRLEEVKDTIAVRDGEIRDLQADIQNLQTTKDAEIKGLQSQIKDIQAASKQAKEETEAFFLAQIAVVKSELDDARNKVSDLEAARSKTQDEHNKMLSLKDKEIQEMSETARGQRGDQEGKESMLSLKGEFQGLQIKHKRELDEVGAAATAKLEAMRTAHDEMLGSRDQEIKEMSDLVQELQEKVEQARQADKDELNEAQKRFEQELRVTIEQYEQRLHDAAAKSKKEKNDLEQERQDLIHDASQRHDQKSRDAASKHRQEMENLMLKHHDETRTARTRNEQALEESAARNCQEIEALKEIQNEELKRAATRQEQALLDAAARYQQEFQSLEAKHLEEIKTVTTREEDESGNLATEHQRESRAIAAKHQEELEQILRKNEDESSNAAIKSQQAIAALIAKHGDELASANSQIEKLSISIQKHQQELEEVNRNHEEELEQVTLRHQQALDNMTAEYDQKLEESRHDYKELKDASLKKERSLQEAVQKQEQDMTQLQSQLETAAGEVIVLETTLKDLHLRKEDSIREGALKSEQELQTATLKYEEELESLRNMYATAVEEITALRRKVEDLEEKQSVAVEEELQSLRTIYATAVEEITALRRKAEDLNQKHSEAVDEAASLRVSLNDMGLKRTEAVGQLDSLQDFGKDEKFERSEAAVEIALLKDKLELADRRFEQDQQAVSDLQRQIQGLQAQIAELTTDSNFDRTEAAVDATLFKDKLELADLEIHLHKGTIGGLQNEVERLQTQLAESSTETKLDQNEAIVDVALLKDKLELADIQIRQARGTVSNLQEEIEGLKAQVADSTNGRDLEQNETSVEIALLKNALELANLENHQDKTTITSLQKQVEGLHAQIANAPKTESYTCQQVRGELSMLGRHQAAQRTDLEALKADMAAASELREQEWKKRADVWDRFASSLQEMSTHLLDTGQPGSEARLMEQ